MVGDKEVGDLPTIADDLVVTKYKMAAEIVNSKSEDYHPKPYHTNLTAVVASPNVCHAIISCSCHPPSTWALPIGQQSPHGRYSSYVFIPEVLKEICDGCKPGTSVRDM